MPKKTVTLNFIETDYEDLVADATEAGYDTPGPFAKDLVLNRGKMPEPRLDTQTEHKLLKLQGANELLQNQLDALLQKATTGGLAGAPGEAPLSKKAIASQVEEILAIEREKRDAKETKEKYEQLLKDYGKLEQDYDKLEEEHEQLTRQASRSAMWERAAPGLAGAAVRAVSERFPEQAASLVTALAGITGSAPIIPVGLPASDETSALLMEMNTALTEEQKPQVHNILNGLMDYPQLIGQVENAVNLGVQALSKQPINTPTPAA
jgi:hypothetical protein